MGEPKLTDSTDGCALPDYDVHFHIFSVCYVPWEGVIGYDLDGYVLAGFPNLDPVL